MRILLAVFLVLCPGLALAGGAPALVQMPCYPQDRFRICAVPAPALHGAGYLPRTVPARARLVADGGRFAILVTPNIVPYELAASHAAGAAVAHCGQEPGERIVARIDYRERYAPEAVDSWKFAGHCE